MEGGVQLVYDTLFKVVSTNDNDVIKESTSKIVEYRSLPGFSEILFNIAINESTHPSVRQLSLIELKNTIQNHWSDLYNRYVIPNEEKDRIRSLLFNSIHLISLREAVEVAITISFIVKYDYPRFDDTIFEGIVNAISAAPENSEHQYKLLMILNHSVKLICNLTKMKEYDEYDTTSDFFNQYNEKRNTFKSKEIVVILNLICPLWAKACQSCIDSISAYSTNKSSGDMLNEIVARTEIISFKILKKLLIHFGPFIKSQDVNTLNALVQEVYMKFCTLLEAGKALPFNDMSQKLYQMIKEKGTVLVEFQDKFPFSYTIILEDSLKLFLSEFEHWREEWRNDPFYDSILIITMTFLAGVFNCNEYIDDIESTKKYYQYKTRGLIDPYDEKAIGKAKDILARLVPNQYFTFLLHTLIARYIKLSDDAIECWDQDPEEYINEELSEAYQTKIPACAELLFYRFMGFNRELVSTEVMNLTKSTYDICNRPAEQVHTNEILLKDACYESLVMGYNTISQDLQFEEVFSLFGNDLENPDPRYRIIRKSIAKIISQWVVDIPQEMHKQVFTILVNLMNDKDIVVRFHTAIAINNLLSEIDFDYEPYGDLIRPTVHSIISLANEMKESNTTTHVLDLVSRLISYLKNRVAPYVDIIVQSISNLWAACNQSNKNLLKASIIGILISLAEALHDLSNIWPILLQMCTQATDLQNPDSTFLLEVGLKLWYSMLQQCDRWNEDLNALCPRMNIILSKHVNDYNVLPLMIRIIETHILVGQLPFLNAYVNDIVQMLQILISTKKTSLHPQVYEVLSTFIQMFPDHAPPVLDNVLKLAYKNLLTSKKTDHIVSCCTMFMNLALLNPSFFFSFFSGKNVYELDLVLDFDKMLEFLIENFRFLRYIEPEKLWTAAFTNILVELCKRNDLRSIHLITDAIVSLILTVQEQEGSRSLRRYKQLRDIVMIKNSPAEVTRREIKRKGPAYDSLKDVEAAFLDKFKIIANHLGDTLYAQTRQCEEQTTTYLNQNFKI